jgi:hypothetical protein
MSICYRISDSENLHSNLEVGDGFDVEGLGEEVGHGEAGEAVLREEGGEVASQRGGIAGNNGESSWFAVEQGLDDLFAEAGAGRVGEDEVPRGAVGLEVIFSGGLEGVDGDGCGCGVMLEIAPCGGSGFDGGYFGEAFGEWDGEEADTRVEIEGGFALRLPERFFDEGIEEEAVDLEEGSVADAEDQAGGFVVEGAIDKAGEFGGAPVEETAGDGFGAG